MDLNLSSLKRPSLLNCYWFISLDIALVFYLTFIHFIIAYARTNVGGTTLKTSSKGTLFEKKSKIKLDRVPHSLPPYPMSFDFWKPITDMDRTRKS